MLNGKIDKRQAHRHQTNDRNAHGSDNDAAQRNDESNKRAPEHDKVRGAAFRVLKISAHFRSNHPAIGGGFTLSLIDPAMQSFMRAVPGTRNIQGKARFLRIAVAERALFKV